MNIRCLLIWWQQVSGGNFSNEKRWQLSIIQKTKFHWVCEMKREELSNNNEIKQFKNALKAPCCWEFMAKWLLWERQNQKDPSNAGVVGTSITQHWGVGGQRQEHHQLCASLGHLQRLCLKTKISKDLEVMDLTPKEDLQGRVAFLLHLLNENVVSSYTEMLGKGIPRRKKTFQKRGGRACKGSPVEGN